MLKQLLYFIFLCFFSFGHAQMPGDSSAAGYGTVIIPGTWTEQSLDSLIKESRRLPTIHERICFISSRFFETPYKANTLVGSVTVKEKLVIDLSGIDCFTFLDYVLALSFSETYGDFSALVRDIRYEKGAVAYTSRNHFFTQWIKNNGGILDYVSKQMEGAVCEQELLNGKGANTLWLEGIPLRRTDVCFFPTAKMDSVFYASLKKGDMAGFHAKQKGLDVTHVGIIIKTANKTFLRHASLKYKKVVDEPLDAYLKKNPSCDGLVIARVKKGG